MSTIRATYVQHGSSSVPNITLNASGQVVVASGIVSSGTFAAPSGSAAAPGVYFDGDTDTGLYSPSANQVAVATSGTARLTVDDAGRLLVGTSSTVPVFGVQHTLQAETLTLEHNASFVRQGGTGSLNGATISLARSRGTSSGQFTAVQSGDSLGYVIFSGANGTDFSNVAAWIAAEVDGTPFSSGDTTDLPGRLVFSTTADGASSPTERMRIYSDGNAVLTDVSVNTTPPKTPSESNSFNAIALRGLSGQIQISAQNGVALDINRKITDGTLVNIRQEGTVEGSISVSGTLVSYNGAHLSRWSQLPGGAERIEILRGTVLSNINEMCEWGEEDNEQLNRMKVSDVEGDKNVSGVFQAWDDDDDTYTNDFYCAMTGDFIIRIAAGVTVERGDLLMSAGDGTAKPQDDDIIRSKTIAKVTSTTVSCTHPDGSYCVPCVLMAC